MYAAKLVTGRGVYLNAAGQSWNDSLRQEFVFDNIICA